MKIKCFFRKPTKTSGDAHENRTELIAKLAQPRKDFSPKIVEVVCCTPCFHFIVLINFFKVREKRPIDMSIIKRLAKPRAPKIPILPPPPSRCGKGPEYWQQLSKPKKNFQEIAAAEQATNDQTGPTDRTDALAVQWARLQRRKYQKGANLTTAFTVSRTALKYQATEKIKKLAEPKAVASDQNVSGAKKGGKGKKKK